MLPTTNRPPDFGEFLKMIRREPTSRPVLYEHYIEWPILLDVLGRDAVPQDDPPWGWVINLIRATPAEVGRRARAMAGKPGYALGAGNSLTAAMPRENIAALLRAARIGDEPEPD
jgi:hypothetical protein